MSPWIMVVTLVLLGLAFVIIEVILIPGTTLVGVIGFVAIIAGILLSFSYFGSETGWLTLGGATAASGVLLYTAFRTNIWRRFALKNTIDSKVNEIEVNKFFVGMEGVALSALKPIGKGEFGGNIIEVRTNGEYVDASKAIRILKVSPNQVTVEIIN